MKKIPLSFLFFLVVKLIIAQKAPYLGDTKSEVRETLLWNCSNNNAHEKALYDNDSSGFVKEMDDTLIYRTSDYEDVEYVYIFSYDTCKKIHVRFSCLVCLNQANRKWLFPGRWRVDEQGYLYRNRKPTHAFIRRNEDCPFLYEVHLARLDKRLPKETFENMEKVNKKDIGTRRYCLRN